MSFPKEYYIRAENEIQLRSIKNQMIQADRIQEVTGKVPLIGELYHSLSQTGERISKIILNGSDSVKEKIEKLANENLKTQELIQQNLIKNGYPKDYLELHYTCNLCNDTGLADDRRCSCFESIVKRIAAEELNKNSPMSLCDFETFDLNLYPDVYINDVNIREVMRTNLEICIEYADNFHIPYDSILISGKTGLGKTHLTLAIAKKVLGSGYSVIYGSVPDMLRKVEREHFSRQDSNDTLELYQTTDLLILDDLGAEFESPFYTATLYSILNTRINNGKPFIVNTNCTFNELKERYGDRIVSRLFSAKRLTFMGNDIRSMKVRV